MSFSQEMKDFLGAWTSVSKINSTNTDQDYKTALTEATKKKTERENDPDTLELEDKTARAKLALVGEQIKNAGVSRGYTSALTKRVNSAGDPSMQGTGLLPATMGGQPGGTPVQATMPLQSTLQTDPDTPAYAGGGVIPDGPDAEGDADADDPQGAQPVQTAQTMEPAVGGGSTDLSSRGRGGGGLAPAVIDSAHEAVKGGYKHLVDAFGISQGGIKTAAQKRAALALQQGAGGLSPQEMDAARKAVDPQNKLTDSQRNLAALGSVYQFWQNKGEPDKATKVAGQMLQHYRAASERYAAIAAHAAQSGDMDLATKAAVKAYANVPDGKDFQIFKDDDGQLNYSYTDANGQTIAKGIATPQQLASSAMGLASGGFDKALLTAAGQREEAAKAGKPQSAADRTKELALPDDTIEGMKKQWQDKNKDQPVDEGYWADLKDATTHILQQNPKTTPNEAARAALALTTPGKADPEKADFKISPPAEDGGDYTVKLNSGLKITLNPDQLDTVMNARAARVKAATDKINADTEASDKPGFAEKAIDAGKTIGSGVAGAVGDTLVGRGVRAVAGVLPDVASGVQKMGYKYGNQPLDDQTVYP